MNCKSKKTTNDNQNNSISKQSDLEKDQAEELVIANKSLHNAYYNSTRSWDSLKKEHNNSYEYSIVNSSYSGWRSEIKITVTNGRVTRREYWETTKSIGGGFGALEKVYIEAGRTVGHNKKGGLPITLDRVYIACAQHSLIVDEEMNDISFKTDESGVLAVCGYTPKNCADDCFTGVSIASFKWLE